MPTYKHPIVGTVTYSLGSDGRLLLSPAWVEANIDTVFIPQLKGADVGTGKPFAGNVKFYKRAIPQLKAAFQAVEDAGLKHLILTYAGSFVPRFKRGSTSSPSNHTFGTAFDINAAWNGFRRPPAAVGAKGDLHAVAKVFKAFGFTWGGDWRPENADGMHFEINRIMSATEIATVAAQFKKHVAVAPVTPKPAVAPDAPHDPDTIVIRRVPTPLMVGGRLTNVQQWAYDGEQGRAFFSLTRRTAEALGGVVTYDDGAVKVAAK